MISRVRLLGLARLERRARRISAARRRSTIDAVRGGAEQLRAAALRSMGPAGGGGRPSAPARPPARRSGRLAESIFVQARSDGLRAEVGSALDYARHLEFGTRRMAARPWLLPAFLAVKDGIRRRILAAARSRRGA